MKILIITIGKKHDDIIREGIEQYTKRIKNYSQIDWKIIPTSDPKTEGSKILSILAPGDFCILLDDEGINYSSEKLAELVNERMGSSDKRLVFIIGGAYGFDKKVKEKGQIVWSLGKLTFPHQIVRLIVAEQVYRSLTIIKGEGYHHAG
ncbi:MAG: 23S rRNA (pseudouridine(1915)-N(3))-methyltransferase RlmH [Candidatus Vogelbacteria bacterium]|nr:23S rRNA (pseudouridine(1915)-N(3))-methyltransferase RlmH [Candidatus Vogelbacteria bacterium]